MNIVHPLTAEVQSLQGIPDDASLSGKSSSTTCSAVSPIKTLVQPVTGQKYKLKNFTIISGNKVNQQKVSPSLETEELVPQGTQNHHRKDRQIGRASCRERVSSPV